MKYKIETGYPESKWWEPFISIFKYGWYGNYPYFKMGIPYTDGILTQHVDLRVMHSDDISVENNIIGKAHIPSHGVLVEKGRLRDLAQDLEDGKDLSMLADRLRSIADGHTIYSDVNTQKRKGWIK